MTEPSNPDDAPQPSDSDQEPIEAIPVEVIPVDPIEPEGDATGGVIPYKNVPALVSYYLGVFSLIPCLALLLGPAALICGIRGLRRYKAHPQVKGAAHAWVGIVLGSLTFLANVVVLALILAG